MNLLSARELTTGLGAKGGACDEVMRHLERLLRRFVKDDGMSSTRDRLVVIVSRWEQRTRVLQQRTTHGVRADQRTAETTVGLVVFAGEDENTALILWREGRIPRKVLRQNVAERDNIAALEEQVGHLRVEVDHRRISKEGIGERSLDRGGDIVERDSGEPGRVLEHGGERKVQRDAGEGEVHSIAIACQNHSVEVFGVVSSHPVSSS